jgi:hypothetical protein
MAVWRAIRIGSEVRLLYENTSPAANCPVYDCGLVSDVDTQGLLEWITAVGCPAYGNDVFVDGGRVHCFLARPRGAAS